MALSTARASDERTYNFANIHALVVEPDRRLHETYRSTFVGFGFYDVGFATEPGEAFAILHGIRTHLIVLELAGHGLAFLRTLRAARKDKIMLTPVIATSALVTPEMVKAARDAGANEFVAKPFSIGSLMKAVLRVVDEPKPFVIANSYVGPCRRRRTLPIRAERRRGQRVGAAGVR
jgi:two-component system, chemotaxis family, chemotaxis protein CheY